MILLRILWFVLQTLVISVSVYLILNYWYGFMENPTFTARLNRDLPIQNVPFPAVSICSLNKISKRRLAQFTDFL